MLEKPCQPNVSNEQREPDIAKESCIMSSTQAEDTCVRHSKTLHDTTLSRKECKTALKALGAWVRSRA